VHASAEVLVTPDPPLLGNSQQVTSDTAQRFVQNQVLVLASDQFKAAVATRLGLRDVADFQVTQVALTDVIRISVTASDENQARRLADTAATVYAADRQRASTARYTAAVSGVERRAEALAAQLRDFPAASGPGAAARLQALSTQYQQLLGQAGQLRLAADEAIPPVQIVKRGTVTSTGGPSPTKVGLLAVLGALVGLGVAVLQRRHRRVIYGVGDLGDLAVRSTTVLPNLAGRRRPPARRRRLEAAADRAVRLHLPPGTGLDGPMEPVVVVLGAASGVGGTFVAGRLVASAAQRGRPVPVGSAVGPGPGAGLAWGARRAADVRPAAAPAHAPGDEPGSGPTVKIIDSPALSSSGAAVRLARGADVVVLVVGLGVNTYHEVHDVLVELAAAGVVPHGMILNELPPRRKRRAPPKTDPPADDGPPRRPDPDAAVPAADPAAASVRAER
jgi:hypothetical protein